MANKSKHGKNKKSNTTTKTTTTDTAATTTTASAAAATTATTFTHLVDSEEVKHAVICQLNEALSLNQTEQTQTQARANMSDRLRNLVTRLEQTKEELQQRLQFTTTAAPDRITRAVTAGERALGDSSTLLAETKALQTQVSAHRERVSGLLEVVGGGVRRVEEVERVEEYQAVVAKVEEWSKEIGSALHIGAEGLALVVYSKVEEVWRAVGQSRCSGVLDFVEATLLYWNKALVQRFVGEFEGVLKSIKWPLADSGAGGTGGATPPHNPPPPPPESTQRLCTLTQYLLQLSLPDDLTPPQEEAHPLSTSASSSPSPPPSPPSAPPPPPLLSNFEAPILPIQLLLNPLEVRFLYHFMGSRMTNSRSHPEWYLIHLLKWARTHIHFLTHRIQPVLDKAGKGGVSAKFEFLRGLVRLAAMKLTTDLSTTDLDEEDLFAHTIQETLEFEIELRTSLGYPPPPAQPSILCVLTQAAVFERWLTLERKFAIEVMDEIVSAENAWNTTYYNSNKSGGGGSDGGGGETAQCGEQVVLLLQGITNRYKRLPQPGHRLQFLELQLDLLDDFRVRLLQVRQGALRDPLIPTSSSSSSSTFPALLNTTHHLASTLADWADLPFFIEMQFYREKFHKAPQSTTNTSSSSSTSLRQRHPLPSSSTSISPTSSFTTVPHHIQEESTPPTTSELAQISGSVFDHVRSLYTHMEGEMVHTLAMYVFSEVRARTQPYRKDKWHYRTQEEDEGEDIEDDEDEEEEEERKKRRSRTRRKKGVVKVSEPSPSICPLFEVLSRHLHTLHDTLAAPLFHKLWLEVAETLDKYMVEEVVVETRFTQAGAHQLTFDMTRALFPIFGEFTHKPESYFRRIKEATILLLLPLPTSLLLLDILRSPISCPSPHAALGEHCVSVLSPAEAMAVLNARIHDE